jgi:hypothetical protein
MSLTIAQAAADLVSKLGIASVAAANAQTQQDVVVAINGAMQMLQTAGQDYFTRQRLTLTLSAGTSTYTIPATVQSVLGPARWNDEKPLRALTSQGEYDQFARIFLGEDAYGPGADGDPVAYFPDFVRNGTSGDIVAVTISVAPAPESPAGTLVVDVVNDAPAYAVADLTSSTVLPIAQNYTESIFLPIARMLVTRSAQFSRPDLLDQLTQDYQVATQRLGYAGGFPNEEQPAPPRKTEG